jgi:hypothetical protein
MDLRSLVELAHDSAGRVNMREELDRPRSPPTGGHEVSSELLPLVSRPVMAVPPAKGLDEARTCVWLRKAALTLFPPLDFGLSKLEYPPVTKFDHGHVQGLVLSV